MFRSRFWIQHRKAQPGPRCPSVTTAMVARDNRRPTLPAQRPFESSLPQLILRRDKQRFASQIGSNPRFPGFSDKRYGMSQTDSQSRATARLFRG